MKRIPALFALLAATLLAGPPLGAVAQEQPAVPAAGSPTDLAAVRIAYLAASGPTLSASLGGTELPTPLAPGEVGRYHLLPSGEQRLELTRQDADPADSAPLLGHTLQLAPGGYYSVLVVHAAAATGQPDESPNDSSALAVSVHQDELVVPPAGRALVRVVTAAGGMPDLSATLLPLAVPPSAAVAADGETEPGTTEPAEAGPDAAGEAETQVPGGGLAESRAAAGESEPQAGAAAGEADAGERTGEADAGEMADEANAGEAAGGAPAAASPGAGPAAEGGPVQLGSLRVRLQPDDAQRATVRITGPGGLEYRTQGDSAVGQLPPGSYVVTAELEDGRSAETEVEVTLGETVTADLDLNAQAPGGGAPADQSGAAGPDQAGADGASPEVTAPAADGATAPEPGAVAPATAESDPAPAEPSAETAEPAPAGPAAAEAGAAPPAAEPAATQEPPASEPAGIVVAEGLGFADVGSYVPVPPGGYEIRFAAAPGAAEAALELRGLTVTAGAVYTVFVYGVAGGDLGAAVTLDSLVRQEGYPGGTP